MENDVDLSLFPRQAKVLEYIEAGVQEILYGGAAGSAKSHLLRILAIIWCMRVPGLSIYLFRRQIKDLKLSHMIGPSSFPSLLKPLEEDGIVNINHSNGIITFKHGGDLPNSSIVLSHVQYENDLENYLSAEFHVLLLDEGSTFTEKMYKFLRSRVRLGALKVPEQYKNMLPFIIVATNPRGALHKYLKAGFVDMAEPDKPFRAPQEDGGMLRCFIPARITDNYMLMDSDPGYIDRLKGMYTSAQVQAYLLGKWDVAEDKALTELSKTQIIDDFKIPFQWKIRRGYDYGYSAPYSVLWMAVTNGEAVEIAPGKWFAPPKGSLIVCGEIYGAKKDTELGLEEDVRATAQKIKRFEQTKLWNVLQGPADHQIFEKKHGHCMYDVFQEEKVYFKLAIKSPGSRVNGLALVRQLIRQTVTNDKKKPHLYIFKSCTRLFKHLDQLILDEDNIEDVDSDNTPDHDWDVLRYLVLDVMSEIKVQKIVGV